VLLLKTKIVHSFYSLKPIEEAQVAFQKISQDSQEALYFD